MARPISLPPPSVPPAARTLFLLHHPDPLPPVSRRVRLIVAAAIEKDAGRPIVRRQLERLAKLPQAAFPVASLVAIEAGFVNSDHWGEIGESLSRVMPERFI